MKSELHVRCAQSLYATLLFLIGVTAWCTSISRCISDEPASKYVVTGQVLLPDGSKAVDAAVFVLAQRVSPNQEVYEFALPQGKYRVSVTKEASRHPPLSYRETILADELVELDALGSPFMLQIP